MCAPAAGTFGTLHHVPLGQAQISAMTARDHCKLTHSLTVPTSSWANSWAFSEVRGAFVTCTQETLSSGERRWRLSNNRREKANGLVPPDFLSFEWILGGIHYNSLHFPCVHLTHSRKLDYGYPHWCFFFYCSSSLLLHSHFWGCLPNKPSPCLRLYFQGTQTKMTRSA